MTSASPIACPAHHRRDPDNLPARPPPANPPAPLSARFPRQLLSESLQLYD
ncbi:MAG: hypothetical protein LQ341_004621 [Variospora aurantia]|nr:MAG: hypothetical protein LQ341_004621 [Variospora aurantia]